VASKYSDNTSHQTSRQQVVVTDASFDDQGYYYT